jgi:hypothetical protein
MHLFIDILRNSILITGLVVVMMMMIESLNIESKGMVFKGLRKTKTGQVIIASLLGSIPGCMGGFATVSLYTHRMFSFGALVAMMIASSGDEAFVMLAMIPDQALMVFAILFVLAVAVGIIVDKVHKGSEVQTECEGYEIHNHDDEHAKEKSVAHAARHFGWKRIIMFIGLAIFIAALATGNLSHDHQAHVHAEAHVHHHHESTFHIDLLSEEWMNVLFAGLSIFVLFVLIFASDHFVEEHLWHHIVKKHLPTIFAWTFGVLLALGIALQYIDIEHWISGNTALMILLATLIGIIPESGPHMIFVTLFATGVVPFPVMLASSISQDGHAGIPLLAESRKSFVWAKLINCIVALSVGYLAMFLS